jgi:iron complex outermembrane receptor protein
LGKATAFYAAAPYYFILKIKIMKRILLFAVCTALVIYSQAQSIKGKIVDASGSNPLSGATISVDGKNIATSDKDGMFSFPCTKSVTITVSFIGYESQKKVVNCNDDLNISLVLSGNMLDNVEITATSSENKSILYQPSSITKLTTPELKRGTGLFLDDAINGNVPGVTMQRRAVSSGQEFNIRGYGNGTGGTGRISSNFDGQGYKVYLNGIPITDAEGITLMDDIDFGSVGNVEITKGPAGTLYGLAVAGVVNLKTIRPEKGKTSLGQDIMFGSYGLQRLTTHFQMGGERSSLLVNYGHQKTDGYTIHNASRKDFVNVAGDFRPNDRESWTVYFGFSKSYDERSGELTIGQYIAKDYSGNIGYIQRNGHSEITSFRAGAGHSFNFGKNFANTTTVFGSGVSNNSSSMAGWTDKDPINYGFRSTFDMNFSMKNGSTVSGITGMEFQRQVAQTVGYGMIDPLGSAHANLWKIGDPYFIIGTYPTPTPANASGITSDKYTTSATKSLFTEWTLALPHDLSFTAGVGYCTMRINLKDRFYVAANAAAPSTFDTSYKGMVSPHLAINKVFNKNFSVYASYSKGYKAPTSSYFYIPFVPAAGLSGTGIIDRGLKPEIGNQFEIGTKGSILKNKLNYQLAFFDATFSNKMSNINVLNAAGTATLYTYVVNGGKQSDQGLEGIVKYTVYQSTSGFFKFVRPYFNFTYSNYKYKDYKFHYKGVVVKDSIVNYDGKPVAGVAKFIGNVGVDVAANCGLYFNMTYFYKDPMPVTSDGIVTVNNVAFPYHATSYSLLDTKIGFARSVSKYFDIDAFLGINNITGTQYPIMVFVNQIPDAYMAAPLKTYFIGGLNLKYNFR